MGNFLTSQVVASFSTRILYHEIIYLVTEQGSRNMLVHLPWTVDGVTSRSSASVLIYYKFDELFRTGLNMSVNYCFANNLVII
jgi:hypothetical protein